MHAINSFLDVFRNFVRGFMMRVAQLLNKLTGGRLSPNAVTIFGLLMHIPIAVLVAQGYFLYAAGLLVIFGLFDALDGQLARLQNRTSQFGMLLDSVTDRMKEIIIYTGIGYFFVWSGQPYMAVWAIAAVGAGVLVSYINAWGEVVTKNIKTDAETNQAFRGGLMSFDMRMFALVVGLAVNHLAVAVIIITVLAWFTALDRLIRISRYLRHAQS